VILDLGVCPECNLEVCGRIRLELEKVRNLAILVDSGKLGIGVGMEYQKLE